MLLLGKCVRFAGPFVMYMLLGATSLFHGSTGVWNKRLLWFAKSIGLMHVKAASAMQLYQSNSNFAVAECTKD